MGNNCCSDENKDQNGEFVSQHQEASNKRARMQGAAGEKSKRKFI